MPTHIYLPRSQPDDLGWCGPVALANSLAIYGLPTTPEECAGACQAASNNEGASADDLRKGLKKFGFSSAIANVQDVRQKSKFSKTLAWVREQTSAGVIVLCGVNGNYANGHWITILRVLRHGIQIWDPHDEGSKVVSKKNLFKAWWNVTHAKDFENAPSQVLLVAMVPASKLTKRAVEIRQNLLSPPAGQLPTEKKVPEVFPEPEEKA